MIKHQHYGHNRAQEQQLLVSQRVFHLLAVLDNAHAI
jgi:hypothetical protein